MASNGRTHAQARSKSRAATRKHPPRVAETLQSAASKLGATAHSQLKQWHESAVGYIEDGRDQALQMEQSLEKQIAQRPIKSVLLAAGVGCVLGMIFRRRWFG